MQRIGTLDAKRQAAINFITRHHFSDMGIVVVIAKIHPPKIRHQNLIDQPGKIDIARNLLLPFIKRLIEMIDRYHIDICERAGRRALAGTAIAIDAKDHPAPWLSQ